MPLALALLVARSARSQWAESAYLPPTTALHFGRPQNRTASPFAVLTNAGCASIAYGTAALATGSGVGSTSQAPYFSSAGAGAFKSSVWYQIVTNGAALTDALEWSDVLLEIKWTFASSKTRSARMDDIVTAGEAVSWEVVSHTASGGTCTGGPCETRALSGTWSLASSLSSSDMTTRLSASASSGFSPSGALWGAPRIGLDNVDADASANTMWWGVGVHSADYASTEVCSVVRNGIASTAAFRSYFFEVPTWGDAAYWASGGVDSEDAYLFATTDATRCANALPFGPWPLSTSSAASAGGVGLSNAYADVLHHTWYQLVVTNHARTAPTWGEILLEIKWEFFTDSAYNVLSTKTLRNRFNDAVLARGVNVNGEFVRWTVVDHSQTTAPSLVGTCAGNACDEIVRSGFWRYSRDALGVQDAFNGTGDGGAAGDHSASGALGRRRETSVNSPPENGGIFGVPLAAGGTIDGGLKFGGDPTGWGVGAFQSYYDNADPYGCKYVRQGKSIRTTADAIELAHRSHLFVRRLALVTIPVPSTAKLFLVTDATQCAESLPFGGATLTARDGAAGFSTGLAGAVHTNWVQYVSRGAFDPRRSLAERSSWEDVLLEIRWTFARAKTLRERLRDAVSIGENVTWRVVVHRASAGNAVCAGGACDEFNVHGLWRFSSGTKNMTLHLDAFLGGASFSTDDGQWGAARSPGAVVDGFAQSNGMGWGIGVRRSTDADTTAGSGCSSVVVTDASGSTSLTSLGNVRNSIYLEHTPVLYYEETIGHPGTRVLAMTTPSACAQSLAWGSSPMGWASLPSSTAYLSNLASNATHTRWVQYVTTGGAPANDTALVWSDVLFEIEWTFDTVDTVEARFAAAATTAGVHVTWNVVEHLDGSETDSGACAGGKCRMHSTDGVWRFAAGAANRFDHYAAGGSFAYGGPRFWGDAGASGAAARWGVGSSSTTGDDTSCGDVYTGGVLAVRVSLRNVIHVVATNYDLLPATIVMPTMAPTMPPTPVPLPAAISFLASLNWRFIAIVALPSMCFVCCSAVSLAICIAIYCAVARKRKKVSMIMNVYPEEAGHEELEAEHMAQLDEHLVELRELHTLGILSDAELKAFEAGLDTRKGG